MKPETKSIKTGRKEIVQDLVNAFGFVESKERIYETYNYGIFNYRETNRDLDHSRVKRIADNILEKGLLFAPIIVNENMEVVDGQPFGCGRDGCCSKGFYARSRPSRRLG
jgi:hypothetical protein